MASSWCRTFHMASSIHSLTIGEAMQITGLSRRALTYAVTTGKLSSRKLPGKTGAHLLDIEEVRRYAQIVGAA